MGLSAEEAHCAVRISLGPSNGAEEVERFIEAVSSIVSRQEAMVRFVSCR